VITAPERCSRQCQPGAERREAWSMGRFVPIRAEVHAFASVAANGRFGASGGDEMIAQPFNRGTPLRWDPAALLDVGSML
jgi:hypothetical protein